MSNFVRRDDLTGFLHEADEALPAIRQAVEDALIDPDQSHRLTEAHRLAHSIRGAAAMVRLEPMARLLSIQEELLEDLIYQADSPSEQTAELLLTCFETIDSALSLLRDLLGGPAVEDDAARLAAVAVESLEPLTRSIDARYLPYRADHPKVFSSPTLLDEESDRDEEMDTPAQDFDSFSFEPSDKSESDQLNQSDPDSIDLADRVAHLGLDPAEGLLNDPLALVQALDRLDPVVLDRFDAIEPELREVFAEEAEDHLQQLRINLQRLHQSRDDHEAQKAIRRSAHTLKGAAGLVGLHGFSRIAKRLENLIDYLHDHHLELRPATFALVETAINLLEQQWSGQFEPEAMRERVADLLARIDLLLDPPALSQVSGTAATTPALSPISPPVAETIAASSRSLSDEVAAALWDKQSNLNLVRTTDTPTTPGSDFEAIDPELLQVFAQEAEDHLRSIDDSLRLLGRNPEDFEALDELRRAIHTLKGAAGSVKFGILTRLTHRMEDVLDWVAIRAQPIRPELHELLQRTMDVITELIEHPQPTTTASVPALLSRYDDLLARARAEVVSEPGFPIDPPIHTTPLSVPTVDPQSLSGLLQHGATSGPLSEALGAPSGSFGSRSGATPSFSSPPLPVGGPSGASLPPSPMESLGAETSSGEFASHAGSGEFAGYPGSGEFPVSPLPHLPASTPEDAVPAASSPATSEIPESIRLLFPPVPLDDIDKIPPELLEVFAQEAEDHLRAIYSALAILERNPSQIEAFREIRRSVHTLKGSAGLVKLNGLTQMAHQMEHLLDRLGDHPGEIGPDLHAVLIDATDVLLDMSIGQYDHEVMRAAIEKVQRELAQQLIQVQARHLSRSSAGSSAVSRASSGLEADSIDWSAEFGALADPAISAPTPTDPVGAVPVATATAPAAGVGPRVSGEPSRKPSEMLRVPLERIDDLVRLVSELVINRTAYEQRMADLSRMAEEIQASVDRLRVISNDLETQYEVSALARGRLTWLADPTGSPSANPTPAVNGQASGSPNGTPSTHSAARSETAEVFDFLASRRRGEFDELEMDRYTQFHLLTRSLSEVSSDLNTLAGDLFGLISDFGGLATRQGRLTREIQDKLMRVRMVPLGTLNNQLQRTVRSVAEQMGKKVDLILEGEQIELEKTVLEEMVEPFLHLLRNAVDHGVETPAVRRERGKPERARIEVRASYQGTQVVLQVRDDGNGIDPQALRAAAVRNGLLSTAEAEALSRDEALQLIFVPGISTAREVSEISGRGVGMDVVKTKILRLKGTLTLESTLGQGTTFTIRLPMSLAITRALLVEAGDRLYAIPVQSITQLSRIDRDRIQQVGRERFIRLGERLLPLVRLADVLDLPATPAESTEPNVPIVVVGLGGRFVAVAVDQLVANREIVVKTLGNHLRRVHGLIGATLMGDGTVVPILNLVELIQEPGRVDLARKVGPVASSSTSPATAPSSAAEAVATALPSAAPLVPPTKSAEGSLSTRGSKKLGSRNRDGGPLTILVVDDSPTVRRTVSNLIKDQGWTPILAKDGLDAIETLQRSPVIPDLVLLDIEMPRMDGYEVLGNLRAQPSFRNLPIVMVTSRAGQKHRRKAMDLGATDYVIKPYDDEEMLARIRRLVGNRRATLI